MNGENMLHLGILVGLLLGYAIRSIGQYCFDYLERQACDRCGKRPKNQVLDLHATSGDSNYCTRCLDEVFNDTDSDEGVLAMTNTHELKTWPDPFRAVWRECKKHEIRKNDRDFKAGDEVVLLEFDADTGIYSGRKIRAAITYLTPGGLWGLPEDMCVFSIEVIERMN